MENDANSNSPDGSVEPADGWPNVDRNAYNYYRELTPSLGFGIYLPSPALFGLGFACVIVFGRSFLRCVRTQRDGVLVRFIADEVLGPYNVSMAPLWAPLLVPDGLPVSGMAAVYHGLMRVLVALALVVVVAEPRPVEACSGIGPGYYPVALADGAVLPTNAVIAVRWKRFPGSSDQLAGLYVADESGEEVALVAELLPWRRPDVEALRLRPVAELAPGTRYELRWRWGDEEEYYVLAWFVTGDGPDVEAPPAPSVGQVIVQPFADAEPEDCGGEYLVRHVDVYLDGERPATYVVREGDRVVATDSATPVRVVANCDRRDRDTETYQDEVELEPGAHALAISAVDFAGNESAAVTVDVELACPGGCRASGHGGAGWGAGLVVLLLSARPRRVARSGRRAWGGRGCRLPTVDR